MTTRINYFENDQDLVQVLGKKVLNVLNKSIEHKGHASLVVSGGSTPKGLFNYLSLQTFPWDKVSIILADDRCVSVHGENSNYHFLKTHLFKDYAAEAKFIPLYCDEDTHEQAAANATRRINHLKKYDLVILGMGTDGHTASLFPQASNLALALSDDSPDVVGIDPVTNDMKRVTQSLKRLLNTREIVFHLIGEEKNAILQKVMQDTNKKDYPSSHVIHQTEVPVEVYIAQHK
ncbi:MAG: 6-phosphogluconolactonase [Gammaproteobacteria bacterium]|nr:6-phosphogluconolactonase [Gammaproteobacteria bacterium]NNC97597.1 6-phosphogluconolactonase [Gammaproteobacteria bacterium]NNM14786.1 6-phosphogluconolactonase [Gammaproteobacteria bacterium]